MHQRYATAVRKQDDRNCVPSFAVEFRAAFGGDVLTALTPGRIGEPESLCIEPRTFEA